MKNFYIKIEENPKDTTIQNIKNSLREYNEKKIGSYSAKKIALLAYDTEKYIGGIFGWLQWGWLFIDMLWVDAPYRRKKIGTALLLKFEEIAQKNGIKRIRLNTGSFQDSLCFYKICGYRVFAEIEITTSSGEEHIDYFLRKDLL